MVSASAETTAPTTGSGVPEARLLVVEDEPNIRDLLGTSLRFAGFEVLAAENGATALHLATKNDIDLVVLDVMLPDLDGFTVTQMLRGKGIHAPVLFLTCLLYTSPSPRD